jgi:hypothetical protein
MIGEIDLSPRRYLARLDERDPNAIGTQLLCHRPARS